MALSAEVGQRGDDDEPDDVVDGEKEPDLGALKLELALERGQDPRRVRPLDTKVVEDGEGE